MRRLAWMLLMGVAAVVGYSHRAWGAGSDWQSVVVVVGGIAIVTLCLVVALVALGLFVAMFSLGVDLSRLIQKL